MIHLSYKLLGTELSWTDLSFEELRCEELYETLRVAGDTMRGYAYSHVIASRKVVRVWISSDVAEANRSFFQAFHRSVQTRYSFNGVDYAEVVIPPGQEPVSFIEDDVTMPEYNFVMTHILPE